MIQTGRIAAAVAHFDTAATNHKVQVFVFHELDQAGPQQHDQAAVAVVRVGAGAAEFDGLRQDVFQRLKVEFMLAVPAADFFCGFFGNQAVAADNFAGCIVKREQVVAMLIIRIDIAAVIAFDFRTQFLGKNLIAQSLGGFDFSLGFCKAYAQADFGARLIETAGGHDVSCLKKMADYSGYTDRFILVCFAVGQIMSGCWKKASGRLNLACQAVEA